jgi:hypothetical protein
MAMKKLFQGFGIVALTSAGTAFADCAPEKLVRMKTQNGSPGIPANSFARKAKVTFRLGNGRMIFTREGSDVPMAAVLSENERAIGAIKYVSYETLETVPKGPFTPPAGIEFKPALSAETKGN